MSASGIDIVLFDGVCNLCNSSVNFIIQHDCNNCFRFAAIQSDIGKKLLLEHAINASSTDSIVLISDNKAYVKSAAALRIAKKLNGLYPLLFVFIALPSFMRDFIYDFVASNRYKWFGKKEQCMVPSAENKVKFLAQYP